AGREIKLFPEPGMAVRNMVLAIFAQVGAIGVEHRSSVEVKPRHLLLVDGDDHNHAMLSSKLLHLANDGTIGNGLGEFVPAGVLFGTKIWPVEQLLQAENLDFLLCGLRDQFDVLFEHGTLYLVERMRRIEHIARLDETTADDSSHKKPPAGY